MKRNKINWTISSNKQKFSYLDSCFAILSLLGPLLISFRLLGNDLLGGKYAEIVLGVTSLGIISSPGYPLYLIITKLFTLFLPLGNDVWQINFSSLLFTSLATFILYITGRRLFFPPLVCLISASTFFFSPFVWQEALLTNHTSFHLLLLTICIYLSLEIINLNSYKFINLKLSFWAFWCGLTGGQHFTLLPWTLTIFMLGITILFQKPQNKKIDVSLLVLLFFVGIILPYTYLPWRLIHPNAFFNSDFVFNYAELKNKLILSEVFSWSVWYLSLGLKKFVFLSSTLPEAFIYLWQSIKKFSQNCSLLTLFVALWGFILNFYYILFQSPNKNNYTIEVTSRLTITFLPFLALSGGMLLSSKSNTVLPGVLSLAVTYWSFYGLNYYYHILGNATNISKPQNLKPTWIGITAILFVSVLAFLQTYPIVNKKISVNSSNLTLIRNFTNALPNKTILTFPIDSLSYPILYLQQKENLRPDIQVTSFSRLWPNKEYSGISGFETLYKKQNNSLFLALDFSKYWTHALSQHLTTIRPVFFTSTPLDTTPTLEYFLQAFTFKKAYPAFPIYLNSNKHYFLSTYRITELAPPEPIKSLTNNLKFIGNFDNDLSLFIPENQEILKTKRNSALINLTLKWQVKQAALKEKFLVKIAISNQKKYSDKNFSSKFLWETTRVLGLGYTINTIKTDKIFTDTYQIILPKKLSPGQYFIHIALFDRNNNCPLSLYNKNFEPSGYFALTTTLILSSPDKKD